MTSTSSAISLKRLVLTTRALSLFDWIKRWGQMNSLWALSFGTSCCAMEYWGAFIPKYDLEQMGVEDLRYTPAQSDLMVVAGTITPILVPEILDMYEKMPSPKWVMAMGACACSGGMYPPEKAYNVVGGIGEILPVDVYIPGCPPSPEAVVHGISLIQEKILLGHGGNLVR